MEVWGEESGEFVFERTERAEDIADSVSEVVECGGVVVPESFFLQKQPETLDQVQVRGIGRQIDGF